MTKHPKVDGELEDMSTYRLHELADDEEISRHQQMDRRELIDALAPESAQT